MKIGNIDRNFSYLLNDLRNCNEILRKDMTQDNVKSHTISGCPPLFRRCIFRKTTVGGAGLGLSKLAAIGD